MSSYMDQMNQMMQPQQGQIDDYDAAFDAIEEREGQHAKDVPQDWDTANPYAVDQGVPHGTGYEGMDAGADQGMGEQGGAGMLGGASMGIPPGMGEDMGPGEGSMGMPGAELDGQQAEEIREALAMRGQQENDMSEQAQQNTLMQNEQQVAQKKRMGM